MSDSIREQDLDTRQILFRSLIRNIPLEAIVEVWNVRATRTQTMGHYVILLDEGTHLCTCLLLINKGLVCRHFLRVGTYSRYATFHISMIPNRWYLDTNTQPSELLQLHPSIPVCTTRPEGDSMEFENRVNFHHLFSVLVDSHGSQSQIKSTKSIQAELFGLSRKGVDCALKADMQQELLNILKTFIYDAQNKISYQGIETFTDINNPTITKHKGRPPKRLQSSVEISSKGRRVLKDSTNVNIADGNDVIDETNNTRGRKCGKCKQFGHYAKTCQNVV